MSVHNETDSGEVVIYGKGLVYSSVCVPADMPIEEVERVANLRNPTGIPSRWHKSGDPTFASGAPNPSPCERDGDRLHWLLSC